jgi:hypothetical protein
MLSQEMILENIRSAMTPGYSRLLIDEAVLEETEPDMAAFMDIGMMALLSGKTRTVTEWKQLLSSAGLRLVKIWGDGKSLIEGEPSIET